jgi:hypothetical protein
MRSVVCVFLIGLMGAPLEAQQSSARTWSELSQEMRPGWTVRLVLPDATLVEGKPATFTPEALTMNVVRTSNKVQHPKGQITIPREQVKTLEIRKNGVKWRLVGTLAPIAAGIGAGAAEAGSGNWLAPEAGAVLFLIIAAGGGVAGYFIGRAVDRRYQPISVTP